MLYILLCSECDPHQGIFAFIGDNIGIILQILSLGAIFTQLVFIYRTYHADHERKKKQATIDTLMTILNDYKEIMDELRKEFANYSGPIKMKDINDENNKRIEKYLAILEYFSVGINMGTYDFAMFDRMAGSYFVAVYDKFKPYIMHFQKTQETAYVEFEVVCAKIRSRRPLLEENLDTLKEKFGDTEIP